MSDTLPPSLTDLRREIDLLLEYASPAEERAELVALLDRYAADAIALRVLHSFYSYLPEAEDDGVIEIRRINNRQGVFLLSLKTLNDDYIYLASRDQAEFLGTLREGIWDQEILEFFGWRNREDYFRKVADPEGLMIHLPVNETPDLCPVCGAADGEPHTLGCPVEICPWCGGQLIHCPCRFEKTGRQELSRESHLDEFHELLEKKGRVPFIAQEQRPTLKPEE